MLVAGRQRIVLMFHEHDRRRLGRYVITRLAKTWREDGHEVVFAFGPRFVPGDVGILHVDLSVVPDPYLESAARYPVVLNGGISDIRKSTSATSGARTSSSWRCT